MTRSHDVSQLTTAELERAMRQLRADLGLITKGSPAHAPILARMRAIDAELARRAGNQQPVIGQSHGSGMLPGPPSPSLPGGPGLPAATAAPAEEGDP
jgi:hypothetical protein